MKSNIRFISLSEKESMKKDILKAVKLQIEKYDKNRKYIYTSSGYYLILLYSKYIIEKEKMNYTKIIGGDLDELLPYLQEAFKNNYTFVLRNFIDYKLYELLPLIAFKDYEIEVYKDRVLDSFVEKNKKYLLVSSGITIPYIKYENVDMFSERFFYKKIKKYSLIVKGYQILDEILGIKRKYLYSNEEINFNDYDEIIFINDSKYQDYYSFETKNKIPINNFFMISKYSNISNYQSNTAFLSELEIKNKIKNIYIDGEKAYIEYKNNESNKINIKLLTSIPDSNLREIISSREEIPNISIYVTPDDIIKNNNRIGFSAYNKKRIKKEKDILDIVDDNKEILKKIRELDDIISNQIDKMIIK